METRCLCLLLFLLMATGTVALDGTAEHEVHQPFQVLFPAPGRRAGLIKLQMRSFEDYLSPVSASRFSTWLVTAYASTCP